jgi:hypothetical protein
MSLLTQASLVVTPNGYKEGTLYSVVPNNSNGDFSVTRATTATRVNAAGLVELVPYNLLTYSEVFSNAAWNKQNSSISANIITAPDGTITADKLVENANNSTHIALQTVNVAANTIFTYTIFAKSAERNIIYLGGLGRMPNSNEGYVWFDLSLGTVLSSTGGFTGSIEPINNGWFRISVTSTASPTSIQREFRIGCSIADNIQAYQGDGTSGLFIWGAQVVEGTSALDYQATETRLNIPRLDYSLGSCPNILLEPQRTNLVTFSEQFDNANWTKWNSSVTANSTISPSGIQNADTYTGSGVLGTRFVYQFQSVVSGTQYTISVYAKKNTNNFIQVAGGAISFGTNAFANFDLNNGVLGTIGSAATARIENVGNGWYRCSITAPAIATTISGVGLYILITSATSAISETNSLSTSVFLWGAQLEAGAYATSYIPTTSASVTRNADQVSNTSASSLIGQTQGTIFLDFTLLPNNPNTSYLFSISDGTQSNLIKSEIFAPSPTVFQFRTGIATLGASQMDAFTNITQLNNKMAISYKLNEVKIFLNGVLVVTDTTATIPATSGVYLGSRNNVGNYIGSYYKSFMLFPTPLTDGEMSMLTSGVYTPALAYAQLGLVSESPACLDSSVNALL